MGSHQNLKSKQREYRAYLAEENTQAKTRKKNSSNVRVDVQGRRF